MEKAFPPLRQSVLDSLRSLTRAFDVAERLRFATYIVVDSELESQCAT
jgi:hypothetical protein